MAIDDRIGHAMQPAMQFGTVGDKGKLFEDVDLGTLFGVACAGGRRTTTSISVRVNLGR